MWIPLAVALVAYLIGSVCFGMIVARIRGVDLSQVGSGNVGATNVGRALGKSTGRVVLLLDLAKGVVAVLGARLVLPSHPQNEGWVAIAAVCAVVGHCYPLWFRFVGGKGAATGAGVMLALQPWVGLTALAGFAVAKWKGLPASAGSLAGALAAPIVSYCIYGATWAGVAALAIALLVLFRHRDNLERLRNGTESA